MADQQVIKEFLVKLGFKKDDAGLKQFTGGVETATKNVVKLATVIQGLSLTIAAGVTAFASNLEKMHFASKRAQASAVNLKAIEQTLENINGSGEDALSSVQSLATFLRSQPGGIGYLKSIGVDALDAKGNMRDMADIMIDLGRSMRDKPFYLAKMQAEQLGMDEQTLRGILDPEFEAKYRKQRELLKNSGFDKAAKDANRFMEQVRELKTLFQIFAVQVQDALMNKLGLSMQNLTDWMREHGSEIADRIAQILITIVDVAEALMPAIKWLVDKFLELDKATDGWSTKIILLVAALNMLGAGSIVAGIMRMAGAMSALSVPILAIAAAGFAGWKIGEWINSMLSDSTKDAIGGTIAGMVDSVSGAGDTVKEKYGRFKKDLTKNGGMGKPGANLDPVKFFMGMGWTKDQAAGIVANLQAESKMDPYAQGDGGKAYGIAQWHPDRQANFEKWAGKNIQNSSVEEQMRFVHYELTQGAERKAGNLLRASTNARQAGEIVSRQYERPAATDKEAMARGNAAVQIAQETHIHVNGSDPGSTARQVAAEQNGVNANIVRNTQVALR
jgi:hypothetical protein